MHDEVELRIRSVVPTKLFLEVAVVPVLISLLVAQMMHRERWLLVLAVGAAVTALMLAFWFIGFVPRHAGTTYIVRPNGIEFERSGKTAERIDTEEIVEIIHRGPAVKVVRKRGRALLIFAGERTNDLLRAIA